MAAEGRKGRASRRPGQPSASWRLSTTRERGELIEEPWQICGRFKDSSVSAGVRESAPGKPIGHSASPAAVGGGSAVADVLRTIHTSREPARGASQTGIRGSDTEAPARRLAAVAPIRGSGADRHGAALAGAGAMIARHPKPPAG